LEKLNEPLEGIKVVTNFGFKYCKDADIIFWADKIVGDILGDYYTEKPKEMLVSLKGNGGKASKWVDEYYGYPPESGCFTAVWALMWLREKFPDLDIFVYGLDGDGLSYYDGIVEQPDTKERIRRQGICCMQLDKLPKEGIYNCNPNSVYKGFEFV